MTDSESIVAETAARIFSDLADPQTLNRATDPQAATQLWQALEAAGLTLAWVPEDSGGSGGSIADGFEVLAAAGRAAAPVPLAETLLAGWLLARAELWAPQGPLTVAPARPADRLTFDDAGRLSGLARGVPFARTAGHLAVLAESPAGPAVALVATRDVQIAPGETLAGDPSDSVRFDAVHPLAFAPAPQGLDRDALLLMGAAMRSRQTAGALETLLAMCVRYANDRIAFERPIAKFQAVQHNLARLADETAAAVAAAGSAADALAAATTFDDGIMLETIAAKVRCAEAAQEGAAIAHQVHGAIGFTQEHVLHRFTLRMLGWRDDFGNESHWAVVLGNLVAARGADAFWPLMASR